LKLARILGEHHDLVERGLIPKAGRSKELFEAEYSRHASALDIPLADFDIAKLPQQIKLECVWPSAYGGDSSRWGNDNESDFSMCTALIARIESDLSARQLAPIFQPSGSAPLLQEIENFLLDDNTAVLRVSLRNLAFDRNVREIVANGIGRNLLRLARENRLFRERPLVVCVDEAHQFLNKEIGDEFSRYPLDAFDLIAKEGRKYSLSICLATQRPRDIPNSVIGQMGTLMVHRLTNDKDRAMVEGAAGEMDRSAAEFLPTLAPGQALLLGVEFPIPLTIQISPPNAKPDSRGPNFQKHWSRRTDNDASEDTLPLPTS
jgi:DNA helicase HerA-like ATPase